MHSLSPSPRKMYNHGYSENEALSKIFLIQRIFLEFSKIMSPLNPSPRDVHQLVKGERGTIRQSLFALKMRHQELQKPSLALPMRSNPFGPRQRRPAFLIRVKPGARRRPGYSQSAFRHAWVRKRRRRALR